MAVDQRLAHMMYSSCWNDPVALNTQHGRPCVISCTSRRYGAGETFHYIHAAISAAIKSLSTDSARSTQSMAPRKARSHVACLTAVTCVRVVTTCLRAVPSRDVRRYRPMQQEKDSRATVRRQVEACVTSAADAADEDATG
jgi:hypothetical protein